MEESLPSQRGSLARVMSASDGRTRVGPPLPPPELVTTVAVEPHGEVLVGDEDEGRRMELGRTRETE